MLAVKYLGPFDALEVRGQILKAGETVDISPDELARELAEQGLVVIVEPDRTKKGDSK